MVRPIALSYLAAVGLFGFAGAVVAKPKNGSSLSANNHHQNGAAATLVTSQTRVNQLDRLPPTDSRGSSSANQLLSKDYDSDSSNLLKNTYGPPRNHHNGYNDDDERSEYYVGPLSDEVYHHQHHQHHPHSYYDHHHHHHEHLHQQHHGGLATGQELNVQPLLWPLAGITLLGVLSALVHSPLLLHLGPVAGRRRRREVDEGEITEDMIKSLLNKFKAKGLRQNVDPQSCLVCDVVASIYDQNSTCLERSVCEVMSRNEKIGAEMDRRLLIAMIAQVVRNNEIPDEFKRRLEAAERNGRRDAGRCAQLYPCSADGNKTVRK